MTGNLIELGGNPTWAVGQEVDLGSSYCV
eukprot:COSAG02_NODE_31861_length_526_cov_0.747073_1_plen_28_part_10